MPKALRIKASCCVSTRRSMYKIMVARSSRPQTHHFHDFVRPGVEVKGACTASFPSNNHTKVLVFFLEKALVRLAQILRRDALRNEAVQVESAVGQGGQQIGLRLIDVPGARQTRVGWFKQHVAVSAGNLDV